MHLPPWPPSQLDAARLCRHVDCSGNEFPFSRGVSFYEVGSDGLIRSARDCVEPALKPGASALYVSPPDSEPGCHAGH